MSTTADFQMATSEEVAFIRKQLGTTEADIREAVAALKDWLEMQPHLPDNIGDARIERMYINCKCSMERTKAALDAYFSLKHRVPEFAMDRDPLNPSITQAKKHIKMVVMPRLTKEGYRIFINTEVDPDPSTYDFETHVKMVGMEIDILMEEDYSLGDILIIDLTNVATGHVLRANINSVRAAEVFYKTAFCRRLKGVHFVNAPKIVDSIVRLVKSALSEKLQKRLHVHLPGSSTLFDHVPREYVLDHLGGTAGPLEKFSYQLFNKAYDMRDWFLEQDKYVSDESRRPAGSRCAQDIYGVAGSFKKLNVD